MEHRPVSVDLLTYVKDQLSGIGRELGEIKQTQQRGFERLERSMKERDAHVDKELEDMHVRINGVEQRLDRMGGAIALGGVLIVVGVPVVLWLLGLVVR